jgi:hypothetical protein
MHAWSKSHFWFVVYVFFLLQKKGHRNLLIKTDRWENDAKRSEDSWKQATKTSKIWRFISRRNQITKCESSYVYNRFHKTTSRFFSS